jgi:hypothetical protein
MMSYHYPTKVDLDFDSHSGWIDPFDFQLRVIQETPTLPRLRVPAIPTMAGRP